MVQEDRSLRTLALGAAAVLTTLLLSGCPARAQRPDPLDDPAAEPGLAPGVPAAPATPPTGAAVAPLPRPPAAARENHLTPATRSLVTQAHKLAAGGDVDGASATLDRALRIEPNTPLLWIERGRLRLTESDAHQAESCGRKALALASGDRPTQAQAGRLLADALRAQHRNPEASEVERQPFMN